ncbi:MAG: cytochrome b/b6 domain-containing protein [Alphaproteobacteria bacterium]
MQERVDTDVTDRALEKSKRSVAVWDPLVRIGHWGLVTGIAVTWLTTEGPSVVHDTVGYAVLALVALRLVWGFVGPQKARFLRFVRAPGATLDYARRLLRGNEPRHVGHNPLGGWMIVALLVTAGAAAATGWLYTTDRFWGVKWMEELHEVFATLILVLAALHVIGVIVTSIRHRENLVAAMWTGRKRAPEGDDVP